MPRLLLSVLLLVRVCGEDVAMTAAQFAFAEPATLQGSSHSWPDGPLVEALAEAVCAFGFFVSAWTFGKKLGWKFGGESRSQKDAKLAARGQSPSRAHSTATPLWQEEPDARPRKAVGQLRTHDASTVAGQKLPPLSRPQARCIHPSVHAEADTLASAARYGDAAKLPQLLDVSMSRLIEDQGLAEPASVVLEVLLLASLRACASKRFFREALALHAHVANRLGSVCGNVWSLLLWSAVEVGHVHSCGEFLERLCEDGVPSGHDFVNIVRHYVHTRDRVALADRLALFRAKGWEVDAIARNRALSLCAGGRDLEMAEVILEHMTMVPMDAIAYNTMMKGFASVGDLLKCFEIYGEMQQASVVPNEMTFGILLDACIDGNELERARKVFSDLRQSGRALNVVVFTTFIKGLVNAGELTEAMRILDEMCECRLAKPDLVTFSTLAKAFSLVGNTSECLRLLERMARLGVQPDGVLFNTILTSCSVKATDPEKIGRVVTWLLKRGLKPSTATISVLIKAFCLSHSWRHALELLEVAPDRYDVWPEPRVYGQLAQSCARAGCRAEVLTAYVAMVRLAGKQGTSVKRCDSTRLHRLCVHSGHGAASKKIFDALGKSGGRVDASVSAALDAVA